MQVPTSYEEAVFRRHPEQVAIAIVKDQQNKYNPITLGWTMLTSHQPPMMAVSVGRQRYSMEQFRRAGEFVLSFPSSSMIEESRQFGSISGREADKLAKAQTATQPATAIDGVLLSNAVANFECRIVDELTTGDHVLFVGEVVAAHINKDPGVGRLFNFGHERLGGVTEG